jgi:uncharacterized protein (TIGR04255 family)
MKLPKKISPDRIKDSIVEVRYAVDVPFEIAVGIFYQSLDDTYTYTNSPLGQQTFPASLPANFSQEITLSLGTQSIFYNDKIKVQLKANSIIFNCLDRYISWKEYRHEIEKVLNQFAKAEVIKNFVRIGVRYISEYPKTDLQNCVKFSFTFGAPDIKSNTYAFSSDFLSDDFRIILNLKNKLPVIKQDSKEASSVITPVSIIDIDVILDKLDITDNSSLLANIDKVHLRQKELFFNLLKEEFLKTLNPEY